MKVKKARLFVMLFSLVTIGAFIVFGPVSEISPPVLPPQNLANVELAQNEIKQTPEIESAEEAERAKSELEILLEQHFSIDYSDLGSYLAYQKDPDNYDRLVKIRWELSERIDSGSDVTEFEKYGLIPIGNGSYELNHRAHPGWLTLNEIFGELKSSKQFRNRELYPLLRAAGFNQQNIGRLEIFLENYDPQAAQYRAMLAVLDDVLTRARELPDNLKNYDSYHQLSLEMTERINIRYQEIMKDWSLNLINSFDKSDQELLFEFLIKRQSTSRMFPISISIEEVVSRFIHDVETDEARIAIRQRLENL